MAPSATVHIVPRPVESLALPGHFEFSGRTTISVSRPDLMGLAERFRADLATLAGLALLDGPRLVGSDSGADVRLEVGPVEEPRRATGLRADGGVIGAEHYRLGVTGAGVRIVGASPEGVQRALTSLLQVIGCGGSRVPGMQVWDGPELAWRGLSLDVVRRFAPVDDVKRVIDLLALYKFNILHLHLTDNEAWRLEIDGWPGLTASTEDGVYTAADVAELVTYARERFVTVIPEIDVPGHAAAVLAAYPTLGVQGPSIGDGPLRVAHLDPDREETWMFVEAVVRQISALFPAPFLHLGGDEALGMDEPAYVRFVDRAIDVAASLGKRAVVWQEACRANVSSDHVVQHWIDFVPPSGAESATAPPGMPPELLHALFEHLRRASGDLARIAAKGSHLLLSPATSFYLDQPHGDPSTDPVQELDRTRLGMQLYPARSLEQMLQWDIGVAVGDVPRDRVAGVEAAVWCETVRSRDDLELLLLPRLPGVAELAWNSTAPSTWPAHRERLASHAPMWQRAGWSFFRAASVDWTDPVSVVDG